MRNASTIKIIRDCDLTKISNRGIKEEVGKKAQWNRVKHEQFINLHVVIF